MSEGGRRVLVVVAKQYEVAAVCKETAGTGPETAVGPYCAQTALTAVAELAVVAGGVGPAAAAAATATMLALRGPFDFVVSAGIGGVFPDRGVDLARIVVADSIVAADLGLHHDEGFMSGERMGWAPASFTPDPAFVEQAVAAGAAPGLTLSVSGMTGTDERGRELASVYPTALAEAMEGAAVASTAIAWGVPFGEVRAISNHVGRFDQSTWTKQEALAALSEFVAAVF